MCLQRKKVQGVLRGAVRSVSKRLAVHCIATAVLPLQRVLPHTMRPKQDRKLHLGLHQGQATRLSVHRPAIRWGRYTAIANAMKTMHFKKTLRDFNILPTRCDTKNLHWRLRQGQATRLSARCPAQRLASDWGRHTAAPNALKTRRCKQKFTDFNVLSTQYGTEKKGSAPPPRLGNAPFGVPPGPASGNALGRHTAVPNALKTGHSKQKFTEFNVLATQYNTEKMDRRLRQGQATRLSAHRLAQHLVARKHT